MRAAAKALSTGGTRALERVRRGEFPVPVLRAGATYRVAPAPLLGLLGVAPSEGNRG